MIRVVILLLFILGSCQDRINYNDERKGNYTSILIFIQVNHHYDDADSETFELNLDNLISDEVLQKTSMMIDSIYKKSIKINRNRMTVDRIDDNFNYEMRIYSDEKEISSQFLAKYIQNYNDLIKEYELESLDRILDTLEFKIAKSLMIQDSLNLKNGEGLDIDLKNEITSEENYYELLIESKVKFISSYRALKPSEIIIIKKPVFVAN